MQQVREQLEAYVRNWYEIFPRGDGAAMSALYAKDARLYLANLPGVRGANLIGKTLGSFPRYVDLNCKFEVTDVELLAENVAIVTGVAWAETTPKGGGETSTDASRFLMVMTRDPDKKQWLCQYDMSQHSPDVPPKAPR